MSTRTERANAEIQKALMTIICEKLNDPRLSKLITVTNVNTTPDFAYCTVSISILESDSKTRKQTFDILKGSATFVRKNLCQMVKMPTAPRLRFVLDDGAIHSDRINEILKNLDIPNE